MPTERESRARRRFLTFAESGRTWFAGDQTGFVTKLESIGSTVKQLAQRRFNETPIRALLVSKDGTRIIVGSEDGSLTLSRTDDLTDCSRIAKAHNGAIDAAVHFRGDMVITGGRDRAIRFWRLESDSCRPLFAVTFPSVIEQIDTDPERGHVFVVVRGELQVRRLAWNELIARLKVYGVEPE